jgi:glycerol kinase
MVENRYYPSLQMTLRLLWALENVKGLREAANNEKVVFGGVDCWLLYKLTGTYGGRLI